MITFLIWGASGWIGSQVWNLLKKKDEYIIIAAKTRLDEPYNNVLREIMAVKPDHVLHIAGITGRPTVDWCENNKAETYQVNTVGHINLARACYEAGVHLTYYGTGCIYNYDENHPIGTSFTEEDPHNFFGSTYSISKGIAENVMKQYPNVLILRIRMPISDDLNPKSLVSKLIKYEKVINVPNSVTVLPEMLPISIDMILERKTGIYNFTNPGSISHNQILELYKQHIDSNFTWHNFTEEEQNKILQSKRCNCELSTIKLQELYSITPVYQAVSNAISNIKK